MTTSLLQIPTAYIDRMVDSLVLAFSADPAARWLYPDAQQYLKHFPEFVRAFGGKAFESGTAHSIGDYAGAALWLAPEVHSETYPEVNPDDQALDALLQKTVTPDLQMVNAVFEQMRQYHPKEPH